MGTIAESRFHRKAMPDTAAQEQPAAAPQKMKPFNAEDFTDILDPNDLPRVWG